MIFMMSEVDHVYKSVMSLYCVEIAQNMIDCGKT